jgi:hypothetical protein
VKREQWKPIEGFPTYRISTRGRVRRKYKSKAGFKELQPWMNATGWVVNLYDKDRQRFTRRVGDLVARHFIRPVGGVDLEFIDGDITNCNLENLAWKQPALPNKKKLPDHLVRYIRTILESPLGGKVGIMTELAERYEVGVDAISKIRKAQRRRDA